MNGQCETPLADHIRRFWETLETESFVRILIDARRDHTDWHHWDSSGFSNDVAKALVAERNILRKALGDIIEAGDFYGDEARIIARVALKLSASPLSSQEGNSP